MRTHVLREQGSVVGKQGVPAPGHYMMRYCMMSKKSRTPLGHPYFVHNSLRHPGGLRLAALIARLSCAQGTHWRTGPPPWLPLESGPYAPATARK